MRVGGTREWIKCAIGTAELSGLRHLQECMLREGQIVACEVILTAVFPRTGVADEDTDHGTGVGIMLNIRDTIQTRAQEHSKHAHGRKGG